MRKGILVTVCAMTLVFALTGTAQAEVFVSSPATGRILALDSTGAVTRTFGQAGGLTEPYGMVLDAARNLVVTDYAAGRILRYDAKSGNASIVASNIRKPDGLSIGPSGEFYLVSRDDAAQISRLRTTSTEDVTSQYVNQVWTVPAMGGLPRLVGRIEESSRLAQTAILTSGFFSGNLIVLSTRPGMIARFTPTRTGALVRAADFAVNLPGEPTGMALTSTGQVLVSTSSGRILRLASSGARLSPDFATGLPAGATRLSLTLDGIVHVTRVGGSVVSRFDSHGARMADLTVAATPLALALNDACVPTPVGTTVAVSPSAGITLTFDAVLTAGQTCLTTTTLGAGIRLSPEGNTIPGFALKLWEDPGFVVYELTTTARFSDTIAFEFFSENPNARLIRAHGSGVEFDDITTLLVPNDPRGRSASLSEFVIYLDTRKVVDVTLLKLDNLVEFLAASEMAIVGADLFDNLDSRLDAIVAAVGSGSPDADREEALELLALFKTLVRQRSGSGIPNLPGEEGESNVAGGLISLADTLFFNLTL